MGIEGLGRNEGGELFVHSSFCRRIGERAEKEVILELCVDSRLYYGLGKE